MELYRIKIFKSRSGQKCSLQKVYTSDRTSLSNAKRTCASTTSAGSPPRATRTSACSTRRCTRTRPSKSTLRFSTSSAPSGPSSSRPSSTTHTLTTRAKSVTLSLASSVNNLDLASQQKKSATFLKLFQEWKVVIKEKL